MKKGSPRTIYLKDYTPPAFLIDTVSLNVMLGEDVTTVRSTLTVRRNPECEIDESPLVLSGEALDLIEIKLDDRVLSESEYLQDAESLTLANVPDQFELHVETRIKPQDNTSLEGLYKSSGNFCTQCEAEGFRKITYFIDRPDVMSVYTTRIEANKEHYPVLLSNGNLIDSGELEFNRHYATWSDPFPKPCYLFALVAGQLVCIQDSYTTRSGRVVDLRVYVEKHNADKCDHAMASLKKAMQWDEQTFGLEYDLDIYMIVAVDDFNMGAMENKGLNVFNSKYVLARPETATDKDYEGIEAVIAHEYFHNWTGNRVTCRDWFQLSLKEGLTVFRDQEFTADMMSRPVKRIDDVRMLRTHQFAEDAGPMAHPVRPQSYIEINNFYTVTVYEKGAEVVRMYHTLLGKEGFRKGMDLYFKRHDGQAVTTDDFLAAMADANNYDLSQFQHWYDQAGTPELNVTDEWDAAGNRYTLTIKQSSPDTPQQEQKQPLLVPLKLGLLASDGSELALQLQDENAAQGTSRVINVTEAEQCLTFINIPEKPLPSLLRDFSAPVHVSYDYSNAELAFLLAKDSDPFNRWEAGQRLAVKLIMQLIDDHQAGRELILDAVFIDALRNTLNDKQLDKALIAEALTLPGEAYIAELVGVTGLVDVDAIHAVRRFMRTSIASALEQDFIAMYHSSDVSGDYRYNAEDTGQRRLRNLSLAYLTLLDNPDYPAMALRQHEGANNMTDSMGAMHALIDTDAAERGEAIKVFEEQWQHDVLVMDKWFSLQAMSDRPDALNIVKGLMLHKLFSIKNPNKVRALIGAFAQGNPVNFHLLSGEGYRFVADRVLELDKLNPQVASRLIKAFTQWKRYDSQRQDLMRTELQRIVDTESLSKDVFEIASKSLV